ncbi:hypothetical protein RND71_008206 [Anisodus tanguticus]|uniref:Uncharacterized protein n=1 Tax=Anisodus tanguticus TaxID=243964 RepID=A0AAE1SMZ2_9SOLA|nr:hypothetical protein RND71_008206 [Anisodus tanguticus]
MNHGLRVKEMELETLISSAGATDSSVHVPVGEEIEEGEVFEDFMVFDESDYDILNHVGNEKKDESDEFPADSVGREEFVFDVHINEPQKKDAYSSSSIDEVDEDNTIFGGEFIRKFREEPEDNTEKVFRSKEVETRKDLCHHDMLCFEMLRLPCVDHVQLEVINSTPVCPLYAFHEDSSGLLVLSDCLISSNTS